MLSFLAIISCGNYFLDNILVDIVKKEMYCCNSLSKSELLYEQRRFIYWPWWSFTSSSTDVPVINGGFYFLDVGDLHVPVKYMDEEVDRAYEEFYEDVHTEFLKFGEIVNFKVCRNGSPHLRGNLYVHYKSMDSAVLAYQSVNGRYYAGKQVQCEFVGVTRWKIAICGEFMKSKLQTCSRGMTCNFIHCFRNPGGDYEWADWDKPPPEYWLKKMAALFGYFGESGYDKQIEQGSPKSFRSSCRRRDDPDRYHSRRSRSRDNHHSRSSRDYSEYDMESSVHRRRHRIPDRKKAEVLDDKQCGDTSREKHRSKYASDSSDSDRNWLDRDAGRGSSYGSSRNRSQAHRNRKLESRGNRSNRRSIHEIDPDENMSDRDSDNYKGRRCRRSSRRNCEQSYELVDGSQGAGTRRDWSDEDRANASNQSGASTNARQQSKVSTPLDDHQNVRGSTYESNITDDWSDEERDSPYTYTEQSPRSDDGFDYRKSKRRRAHKLKQTSIEDRLGRGNGEVEHDHGKPVSSGRSYRSDSRSRCHSRKDTGKLESCESERQFPDHFQKSKRTRDTDYCKVKGSHAADYRFDESAEKRGRWEPDKGDSTEHTEFHQQLD